MLARTGVENLASDMAATPLTVSNIYPTTTVHTAMVFVLARYHGDIYANVLQTKIWLRAFGVRQTLMKKLGFFPIFNLTIQIHKCTLQKVHMSHGVHVPQNEADICIAQAVVSFFVPNTTCTWC